MRFLIAPLAWCFALLVYLRLWAFRTGLFKSHSVPIKTVAVGGLEVGGTGKTPVVGYLLACMQGVHRRVGLLSRGYGRKCHGLVLHRPGDTACWETVGDEATMLLENNAEAYAAICAPRVSGARALHNSGCTVALLDDGFSHLALKRDIDVLVLRGEAPFGTGHMMPWGSLREPVSSTKRATVLWLHFRHGVPKALCHEDGPWPSGLPISNQPLVLSDAYLGEPRLLYNSLSEEPETPPASVLLLCAIARPHDFQANFRKDVGWPVAELMPFRDHHAFTPRDLRRIQERALACSVSDIVLTAKDAVKIRSLIKEKTTLRFWVVQQHLRIQRGGAALRQTFADKGIELQL